MALATMRKMAAVSDNTEILSCGVDAYTAVFRGPQKLELGMTVLKRIEEITNAPSLSHRRYSNYGYQGFSNDFYFYGLRGQNLILGSTGPASRVVEELSRDYWPEVTRLDLEVTVQLPFQDENLVREFWAEQEKLSSKVKRWPAVKFVSSDTGETLYMGKRGSGTMLRLYDKGYALELLKGIAFRFEVEYRDKRATDMAHNLARVADPNEFTVSNVFQEYYKYSLRMPIEYGDPVKPLLAPARAASHADFIEWARQVISPTMLKLSNIEEGQELLREMGVQTSFLDTVDLQDSESEL